MKATKFPYTLSRSEVKRIVWAATDRYPACRAGQAVCNNYEIPDVLKERIYECNDSKKVVDILYDFFHSKEYQNFL